MTTATASYMTRMQRENFAAKNGGVEGLRISHPVISGLIDTNLVLDALVDAYMSGNASLLNGLARAVRIVEASSAQLHEPGLERISIDRAEFRTVHDDSGATKWQAFHTVCGWAGELHDSSLDMSSDQIGHVCSPFTPVDIKLMSRADRAAFAAANDGVEGLREQGHYAVSRLLASTENLDNLMNALDASDEALVDQIAQGLAAADASDTTRPWSAK